MNDIIIKYKPPIVGVLVSAGAILMIVGCAALFIYKLLEKLPAN